MRRILLMAATLGIVCVVVSQVQAHDFDEHHHGHGGYYVGYHGPVVVAPRVWPRVVEVVPAPVYPRLAYPTVVYPTVVYPRPYRYPYYCAGPSYGFSYQGPGLSIGVGF
jgi:hypothetical protein